MKRIRKILIANRGEIAVRIIRTCNRDDIRTTAIYAPSDAEAMHVRMADEAILLPGELLSETYLNVEAVIHAARKAEADAIHPGYGFLSENPLFARACEQNGIIFIGPDSQVISLMGNKVNAREAVKKMGVPVLEGATGTSSELKKMKDRLSYPLLVKPAAGGGGKGMKIIHSASAFDDLLETAEREALNYFGDPQLYLEKYIENARHIEIQVLADEHGSVIHLFERECSIQRRYQKIIEESPSPGLTAATRGAIAESAIRLTRGIGYRNAGTIEFLLDEQDGFYFLEMNTRIQVEHPVTEMVTGIDVVRQQIHIASGKPLALRQNDLIQAGHAIEARIYAEDALHDFLPSPGEISYYHGQAEEGIRIDSAVDGPASIPADFDPMIAKVISHGTDREESRKKLVQALAGIHIHGVRTNIPFLTALLNDASYKKDKISVNYCQNEAERLGRAMESERNKVPHLPLIAAFLIKLRYWSNECPPADQGVWASTGRWRQAGYYRFLIDGEENTIAYLGDKGSEIRFGYDQQDYVFTYRCTPNRIDLEDHKNKWELHHSLAPDNDLFISIGGHQFVFSRTDILPVDEPVTIMDGGTEHFDNKIVSPMHGKIVKITVKENDTVTKGDTLFVIDSMKIENSITAPRNGTIEKIVAEVGDQIKMNTPVLLID